MFIVFSAVLFHKSYTPNLSILSDRGLISTHFQSYNGDLSTVRLPNGAFPGIRFFPAFRYTFFQEREVVFMEIDFIQELKKRDELLTAISGRSRSRRNSSRNRKS